MTKKKLAKKTKTNRGRPRKEFKPKHKRLDATNTALIEHRVPTNEKILKLPKDRSILYLFIFSIVLFICALGISFFKEDVEPIQDTPPIQQEEVQNTQEMVPQPISEVRQILENMYGSINNKNFDDLLNYFDNNLRNSDTIRTYFNTRRLTKFLDGVKDSTVTISDIQEEQVKDLTWEMQYKISYELLDQQTFEENWTVTIVKKDDEYKISTIKCETTGCSRMPFFNPAKYNIK